MILINSMKSNKFDRIIIGGGIYGLYAALLCARKNESVLVLEKESECFARATYVNQARVHLGYHYPRSLSTAAATAGYFDRFVSEYPECINGAFDQVYATSTHFSWTNAEQFEKFANAAGIPAKRAAVEKYFKDGVCDGAFLTTEVSFDAKILKERMLKDLAAYPEVTIRTSAPFTGIERKDDAYVVTAGGETYETSFVLNTTYACVNEITSLAGFEPFRIKYELCEVILCEVSEELRDVGITVMDGPFFSIMPFGKTGLHTLTSVTFTPHETCYEELARFDCQKKSQGTCSPGALGNCNTCPAKPKSAWPYMEKLAKKYLDERFAFTYVGSLYSMKPILVASDVDDSRPTAIKIHSEGPTFLSVLSGKITTVYDLEEIL